MSDCLALHVRVYGLVQGVYYRDFTCRHARRLRLTGWVRNLPDGTVEAVAEGNRELLLEFLSALKNGPPRARVDNIVEEWRQSAGIFSDFLITG